MKKTFLNTSIKFILAFTILLASQSVSSQTVTVANSTAGALTTYTFEYTTTQACNGNVFMLALPDSVGFLTIPNSPIPVSDFDFYINNEPVNKSNLSLTSAFNNWSGIQIQYAGVTIPAGSNIKFVFRNVIQNATTTGNHSLNFKTTNYQGGAIDQYYANVVITSNVPSISAISPISGETGTTVTLTGTNFIGATAVKFNGVNAASYTVNNATSITAVVPSGTTTGTISVETPNGNATGSSFTVNTTNYLINPTTDGGFEGTHGWTVVNTSNINKWVIGGAQKTLGNNGAFVSDNGTTNTVTNPQASNSKIYIYKDVIVPLNASSISLSFKYKNAGSNDPKPRCLFALANGFPPLPTGGNQIIVGAEFATYLSNATNWITYTNDAPLSTDRLVTYTSEQLIPGETYRVVFEWSAANQTSYTQTSPITKYPTGGSIQTTASGYTPGAYMDYTFTSNNDGNNFGLEWSVDNGAQIVSGQGTSNLRYFVPLGTTGVIYTSLRYTYPTPTYASNGTNSGPLAIDEVAMTFSAIPKITSIAPLSGAVGSSVTLTGEFFGATDANNVVYLGGVKCNITAATTNSITVTVPANASLNNFSVVNTTSNLSCISQEKFVPTNTALSGLSYNSNTLTSFEAPVTFTTGTFATSPDQKFVLADVDLDGKADIFSYSSSGLPQILKSNATSGIIDSTTFLANNSISNVSQTPVGGYSPKAVLTTDLNNDGKLDFAMSNSANNGGFANINSSTSGSPSLLNYNSLLSSTGAYQVNAAFLPIDINLDGRTDIFGMTGYGPSQALLYFTKNTTTGTTFSSITGNTANTNSYNQKLNDTNFYSGVSGDLDGDGKTDVVLSGTGKVYVLKNTTTQGNPEVKSFSFSEPVSKPIASGVSNTVKLADLDLDGKLDVIATNSTSGQISVYKNNSTTTNLSIMDAQHFALNGLTATYGLALADMNGDGKPDVVVSDNAASSKIAYLENTSVSGAISFATSVTLFSATGIAYPQLELADIDGDNKPDIIAANNTNGIVVFRNRAAEAGKISADQTICSGITPAPLTSLAPATFPTTGTITYKWQSSTSPTSGWGDIASTNTVGYTIPSGLTTTTYYRRAATIATDYYYTNPIKITVTSNPTITNIVSNTVCGVGSVPINAETSAGSTSFVNWYDAATGGSLIGRTTSGDIFNTPSLNSDTVFYAQAEDDLGCISLIRTAVNANINLALPTVTLGSFVTTKCDAGSFKISATTSLEAEIKWYDAPTGGNVLKTGDNFVTPILTSNTTYYAEASNCNGTSSRIAVALTLVATPSITSAPSVTACQYTTVNLTAQSSAGTLYWYDVATGGVSNSAYTSINNLNATTTRYVMASVVQNGVTCESPRTAVTVSMLAGPAITNSIANQTVYGANTSSLWVTVPGGSSVSWYADAAGTQLLLANNGNYTTPVVKQTTTFYAIATSLNNGCKSAPRAIIVTYSGPLFDGLSNTFAMTNQENVAIKATGLSRLSTTTDWVWQRSDNGGISWSNITSSLDSGITYSGFSGRGGTSSTLIISKAEAKLHGFQYRLKLIGTDNYSSTITNASVLTIADLYGECANATIPIQNVTNSTQKTGLTTLTNTNFTSNSSHLNDGNVQTGMVVLNSDTQNSTSSLSFDGGDDLVLIGQPAIIQSISTGVTVEAWINPSTWTNTWYGNYNGYTDLYDRSGTSPIVSKQGAFSLAIGSTEDVNYSYGYMDYDPDYIDPYSGEQTGAWLDGSGSISPMWGSSRPVESKGVISFTVYGNGGNNFTIKTDIGTDPINLYEWSHIAATYDVVSEKLRIYVNGSLVKEVDNQYNFTSLVNNGDLTLGQNIYSRPNGEIDQKFNGSMDEVRIWNFAKNASDIQTYKNTDVTGSAGLAAYYKFMDATGTRLSDLSGNNATGTLQNFSFAGNSNWSTNAPGSLAQDVKRSASITADLGSSVVLNGIKLANFSGLKDGGTTVTPNFTGGYVESSTDNITWTRQISNLPSLPINGQTLALNGINARYIRIKKEDQTSSKYYGLSELSFVGGGYETVPYFRKALPANRYVLTGTELNLSAVANAIVGETITSYQWSSSTSPLDGTFTNLTNVGSTSGTTSSNLVISNYTNGSPTYYRLTATQSNGCEVKTQILVNLETSPYYPLTTSTASLQNLSSWTVNANGTSGSAPLGFANGKYFILQNSAGGTYEIGADWANDGALKLNGNSLSLSSTFNATLSIIEGFGSTSYIKTLGTGYLKSLVSNSPKVFPVGTSTTYSPVTITNNLGSDEIFSTAVSNGVTNPASTNYINKTWKISKENNTTSGGSNLDVTFEWDSTDITGTISEPMVYYSTSASPATWSVLSATTNYSSIERGSNKVTLKGFKGIIGTSIKYFIIRNAPPTITSIVPNASSSGNQVVINGTGFTGATAITLGGTAVSSYVVNSATQITAVVGSGTTGHVSVTGIGGSVSLNNSFTYVPAPTITAFTPAREKEGARITITGTNFMTFQYNVGNVSRVLEVRIGGVVATSYQVIDAATINAFIPIGATSGTVSVTTSGGTASMTGFELGFPVPSATSLVSWYPDVTTSVAYPRSASTYKQGVITNAKLSVNGLNTLQDYSSSIYLPQMNWQTPSSSSLVSTLDVLTAPYISLKFDNSLEIDFDRFVAQGVNVTGATKLQLRWSVDNFNTSLGELTPTVNVAFNSNSTSSYSFTSISLANNPIVNSGQNIEFRLYVYNAAANSRISFVKSNNYSTTDSTPTSMRDGSDAIAFWGKTKQDPGLAAVSNIEARLSDRQMVFNTPVSNTNGAITVSTPANNGIADYANNQIIFRNLGTTTLSVAQAGSTDYASATRTATITVRDYPAIQFSNINAKVGDPAYTLTGSSPSSGAITYQSGNTNTATIASNVVTILQEGMSVLTASQVANGNYLATSANAILVVKNANKQDPTVSWIAPIYKTTDSSIFTLVRPTSNSTGAFTYYSSNPNVAIISGNTVTIVGEGTSTITAVQVGNTTFNWAQIATQLIVESSTKTNPTISNFVSYTKLVTDSAFTISAPTSTNSNPFTYIISNPNVAKISGNTITLVGLGVAKIIASQQASGNYNPGVIEATLTVNLPPLPIISYTDPADYRKNTTITSVSASSTGGPISSFSISPSLPLGITFNTTTGVITGTPTVISTRKPYIVTAKNFAGEATATVELAVVDIAPSGLSYTTPNTFVAGTTIAALSPINTGSEIKNYSISPSLPGGLILNPTTGTISGTPSVALAATTFTITGSNSGGSTTATISITVTDAIPIGLEYSTPNVLFKGVLITPLTPSNSGGAITNYAINPSLPAGLTLNTTTGAISGRPTVPSASTDYVITGTNSGGSVTKTISILVNDNEPTDLSYSTPNIFGVGLAITPLTPTVYGGVVTRYSIDRPLPAGLNFDTTTGVISGTPTQITANATYMVTAFNFMGRSNTTLEITIGGPATNLSYGGNLTLARNAIMTTVTPTINSTTSTTYSVSPSLPAGLVFDTTTGQIFGMPTTIQAAQSYTVTANNGFAPNTTVTFTIAVVDVPVINYVTPSNYTAGVAIANLIPSVSGLTPITLRIAPNLPDGLLFDTTTGTISGTPTSYTPTANYTITATNSVGSTSVTIPITVNKRIPSIGTLSNSTKTFGDADFDIVNPTTNSTGSFSYVSSNTAVATINGNTITIIGAGTAIITATITADADYDVASTTAIVTVNKAVPTIGSLVAVNKTYGDANFNVTTPTSNATGTFSYASSDSNVVSISGSTVTIVGAGSATITATQTTDTNYLSGSSSTTITVAKAAATLSAMPSITKNFGDIAFTLVAPTSAATGAVTFASSDTNVVSISGNTITIIGAGTATVTATQATDANYLEATTSFELTVNKIAPSLGVMTAISKTFGDANFTITPPSTNSSGGLTYTSSDTNVATITGDVVTIVGAGTASIAVAQATDTNYLAATTSVSITVSKAPIVFGTTAVVTKNYGDADFIITPPQTNSTGAFTYTCNNPSVATITGNVVTIIGIGTATISASQATDANYFSGSTTISLTVNKTLPTLSAIPSITKTFGDANFTISTPISNSSGAITLSSSDTNVATINGNTVTIIGAGTTTITASQVGDVNFDPGTTTSILTVNKAPVILSTMLAITKNFGDATFNIAAPTSVATGAITFASSDLNVATISGNTVTIVGAGTATITASQATDANYLATSTTAILTVNKLTPVLSNFNAISKTTDDTAFTLITPASSGGTGLVTYSSSNLAVATIVGNTVTITGSGSTTITATQAADANFNTQTISAELTVGVGTTQTPELTSPLTNTTGATTLQISYTLPEAPFPGSVKLVFTPSAGGSPIVWIMDNGTSASFAYPVGTNPTLLSNVVSGTALAFTTYNVTITYQDIFASPAVSITNTNIQTLAPPSISIAQNSYSGIINVALTPIIVANSGGFIGSFTINPALPDGLVIDSTTGNVTGIPTAVLTASNYTITAINPAGASTVTFSLFIDADTDGDGIGDRTDPDIDGDGIPNISDVDINGDGVLDNGTDIDGDGINDANDTDIDGDGVPNAQETLDGTNPNVPGAKDTDGDGVPDYIEVQQGTNPTIPGAKDTDGDGVPDYIEVQQGTNPAVADALDSDGDGISNYKEGYNFRTPGVSLDTDRDGIPDYLDLDADGDGVLDRNDAFPINPLEWTDSDRDGTGDNADTDDDNDGILDACDVDVNGDSIPDNGTDMDGDGIIDSCDTDKDGDGVNNTSDNCPNSSNANQADRDRDGQGDVCDTIEINAAQAITPNGDGINDTWVIYNLGNHPGSIVRVFNSNGVQVFYSANYQNNWMGNYQGSNEMLPVGSYLYQIDLGGDGSIDSQGWLYITK